MHPITIIGITGRQGHGKTTFGEALVADLCKHGHDARLVLFSAPIKEVSRALLGGKPSLYYGSQEERAQTIPIWSEKFEPFATYRSAMQFIGTELFRNHLHPDIWLWAMRAQIDTCIQSSKAYGFQQIVLVIPDLRFANEAKLLLSLKSVTIRVKIVEVQNLNKVDEKFPTWRRWFTRAWWRCLFRDGKFPHRSEWGIDDSLINTRFASDSVPGIQAAAEHLSTDLQGKPTPVCSLTESPSSPPSASVSSASP